MNAEKWITNADGSDKRTQTVTRKSANPRCFKNFNPALYVDYESNKKAWTTAGADPRGGSRGS